MNVNEKLTLSTSNSHSYVSAVNDKVHWKYTVSQKSKPLDVW